MITYLFHPACLLLPEMQEEAFTHLRQSIQTGYDANHPILLCEGKILDGRHRYLACLAESIEPLFQEWSEGNPYDFVRRTHQSRRRWRNGEQKYLAIKNLMEAAEAWQDQPPTQAPRDRNPMASNGQEAATKTAEPLLDGPSASPRVSAVSLALANARKRTPVVSVSARTDAATLAPVVSQVTTEDRYRTILREEITSALLGPLRDMIKEEINQRKEESPPPRTRLVRTETPQPSRSPSPPLWTQLPTEYAYPISTSVESKMDRQRQGLESLVNLEPQTK